jgi:amino acid permease
VLPPSSQSNNNEKPSFRFSAKKASSLSSSSSSSDDSPQNPPSDVSSSSPQPSIGSATVAQEIFNLVKCIIGAGVLSLPAGIALMGTGGTTTDAAAHTPTGMLLSTACGFIAIAGGISAYTFSLIARVCKMTNSETYADCWKATRGPSKAWIVALSSTLDCFAGTLTYSMVLADTFHQLLSYCLQTTSTTTTATSVGGKLVSGVVTALEAHNNRSTVLLLLTATALMPLCCIRNLSSLAPFSLVGILGMVYTAVVIGLRCFDGSYRLPNGRFLADLTTLPSFSAGSGRASLGRLPPWKNPKSLILVSMLSTAYIAHFNAPKFYRELKDSDRRPKRFHLGVVLPSFGISVVFYALVSSMGYLTFGSATEGMILTNYSTRDVLVTLSRFAVGLSLIFSYPLLFAGLRDGIVDLINQVSPFLVRKDTPTTAAATTKPFVLTDQQSDRLTVGIMSLITILALKITDLTFVASMSGALLGTSLIFIFPPLMFRSALATKRHQTNTPFTRLERFERGLCSWIVGLGVFIAGVGAKMAWRP